MGLFTSKTKTKNYTPPEVKAAGKYLNNTLQLYAPGESPEFPTQQIADMSGNESTIQTMLADYLNKGTEGYNLAMGQVKSTLNNDYDPTTSDFYKGFRNEQQTLKSQSNADIRRQAQKAGSLRSTPTASIQAENGQQYDSKIMEMLGSLFETERNRMDQAGRDAGNLGQSQFDNTVKAESVAAVPRDIENQKNAAVYNTLIQELLFPYEQQLKVASALFGYQPTIAQTGGGLTDLGFLVNAGASAAGAYFGAK